VSAAVPVIAALAIVGLYVLYQRMTAHRVNPAVETDTHSLDWMTAPDLAPLAEGEPRPATPPHEWRAVTVGSLTAADELLDELEAAGFSERELVLVGTTMFLVRWR
jgi:hypothetical protein